MKKQDERLHILQKDRSQKIPVGKQRIDPLKSLILSFDTPLE